MKCLGLFVLVVLAPLVASAQLAVSFEEGTVVVSGATLGADVVWTTVSREAEGTSLLRLLSESLPDDDGDGVGAFEPGYPPPLFSVWIAVDLSTGAFAAVSPEGFTPPELPISETALSRGALGLLDRLEHQGRSLYLVLLRPGVGVWRQRTVDGSGSDDDARPDGRTRLALDRLVPVGLSPEPPAELATGDVLVLVDPDSLATTVVALDLPASPGGGALRLSEATEVAP